MWILYSCPLRRSFILNSWISSFMTVRSVLRAHCIVKDPWRFDADNKLFRSHKQNCGNKGFCLSMEGPGPGGRSPDRNTGALFAVFSRFTPVFSSPVYPISLHTRKRVRHKSEIFLYSVHLPGVSFPYSLSTSSILWQAACTCTNIN